MKKILVICGQTATGKTKLALRLAKEFGGEIVSADSRQVYRGMDIATGKELSRNSKFQIPNSKWGQVGFYKIEGVRVWGYDLVDPKKEFSVAQYVNVASKIIDDIEKRGKLPIMVGGTGLYIKALVDGIDTISIPQNQVLRKSLAKKSVDELCDMLGSLDPIKSASMNFSDRRNPRRLIRAIEVALWRKNSPFKSKESSAKKPDILFVGLTSPKKFVEVRIRKRSQEMLTAGLLDEILRLLQKGISWKMQSMNTIGYKEWESYFEKGEKERKNAFDLWTRNQVNFAKRQTTWFKKDKRINWFDVSKKGFEKDLEKLVEKWHNI